MSHPVRLLYTSDKGLGQPVRTLEAKLTQRRRFFLLLIIFTCSVTEVEFMYVLQDELLSQTY